MTPVNEEQRIQVVLDLITCIGRLVKPQWRELLKPTERVMVSEIIRDLADAIDHGEGDRRTRKLRLVPKRVMRSEQIDPLGRSLYRIL
jgi:hypothetical protein